MRLIAFTITGAAIGWGASGYDNTWAAIGAVGGFLLGGLLCGGLLGGERP